MVTLPGLRRGSPSPFNLQRPAFDDQGDNGRRSGGRLRVARMINSAFGAREVGYGTAIAVVLAVLTLVLSVLVLRLFRDDDA